MVRRIWSKLIGIIFILFSTILFFASCSGQATSVGKTNDATLATSDDIDGDGIPNDEDDDLDGDGILNEEDPDDDNDGVDDDEDLCPNETADTDTDDDGCTDEEEGGDDDDDDDDTDTDGDGVYDDDDDCDDEVPTTDVDGDGCEDAVAEADRDGDGIPDDVDLCPDEAATTDTDGDGCTDDVVSFSTCTGEIPDATTDPDGDGITECFAKLMEQAACTGIGLCDDCDVDGILNIDEMYDFNVYYNDSCDDEDAILGIYYNYYFYDSEGVYNGTFYSLSDPTDSDTDDDGLVDYYEYWYHSNPQSVDTDGDALTDYEEIMGTYGFATDPTDYDTDDENGSDKEDQDDGLDPTDNENPTELEACMSEQDSAYYSNGFYASRFSWNGMGDYRYYVLKLRYTSSSDYKYVYFLIDIYQSSWGLQIYTDSTDSITDGFTWNTSSIYYYYCSFSDESGTINCYLDNMYFDSNLYTSEWESNIRVTVWGASSTCDEAVNDPDKCNIETSYDLIDIDFLEDLGECGTTKTGGLAYTGATYP